MVIGSGCLANFLLKLVAGWNTFTINDVSVCLEPSTRTFKKLLNEKIKLCLNMNLRGDLVARICIITAAFSIISYYVVERDNDPRTAITALFILFGIVVMISVQFDLWRYDVAQAEPKSSNARS